MLPEFYPHVKLLTTHTYEVPFRLFEVVALDISPQTSFIPGLVEVVVLVVMQGGLSLYQRGQAMFGDPSGCLGRFSSLVFGQIQLGALIGCLAVVLLPEQ